MHVPLYSNCWKKTTLVIKRFSSVILTRGSKKYFGIKKNKSTDRNMTENSHCWNIKFSSYKNKCIFCHWSTFFSFKNADTYITVKLQNFLSIFPVLFSFSDRKNLIYISPMSFLKRHANKYNYYCLFLTQHTFINRTANARGIGHDDNCCDN